MSERKEFGNLLSRIARRVTAVQTSEICCGDLTLEQFSTLRAIDNAPEAPSLGKLSGEMGVDLSTMSRNVTVLERNDHVGRTRSADDGRVVTIKLTAKGRRALDTLRCDEEDTFGKIYETVPAAARPQVVKALAILDASLNGSPNGPGDEPCCGPAPARPGRARRLS
jgi:DNA-binding MarR family transcriptional regulator